MSLFAPSAVSVGETFIVTICTDPSPDVELSGFVSEVVFPDELNWLPRATCEDEVQVQRQDGGPFALCQSFLSTLLQGATHSVVTEIAVPPLEPLNVIPGSAVALVELDFNCKAAGTFDITLTAFPDSPFGSLYGDVNANLIEVRTEPFDFDGDTVPNQVADVVTIACGPAGTPTPCPPAGCPTPTATPTPTPSPCVLQNTGGPGMSVFAPSTVSVGQTFMVTICSDPSPDALLGGFQTELLFPSALTWLQRPTCLDEVLVRRLDGVPIALCISDLTTLGAGHAVISEIAAPPLEPLNVVPGSATALVELDFSCAVPGKPTH